MNKKNDLLLKIIIACMVAITLSMGIFFVVEMYILNKVSYFSKHFLLSICLFCIGIIALLLPRINSKKFSGENKGDSLMVVVGFLLIICSLFSIMISYMMG